MDINRLNAPLHIRCPKCGADLEYNPRRIKDRIENITSKYKSIAAKLPTTKDEKQRKKARKDLEKLRVMMSLLKEDNNMISTLLKEETDRIVRRKIKEKIGDEAYLQMIREAEEEARSENVFHTYELAIQRYSNIPDVVD